MFDLIHFVRGNRKRKGNPYKLTLPVTNLTQLFIFIIIILQSFTVIQASTSEEASPEKTCPYYWRLYNNRCFYTKGAAATDTRADAIVACEAYGGQLAKILSREENVFMRRILQTYNPTWVGAEQPRGHGHGHTDKDHNHGRGQPTHWNDGTLMNYTNFKTDEVEDDDPKCTDDCCGLTVDKNGDWRFKSCDTIQEYICEIDLGYPVPNRVHPRTTTMTPMTTTPEIVTVRPEVVAEAPDAVKVVTGRAGKKIEMADEQVKTTTTPTPSTVTVKPSSGGGAGSMSSGIQNILHLLIVVLVLKILRDE